MVVRKEIAESTTSITRASLKHLNEHNNNGFDVKFTNVNTLLSEFRIEFFKLSESKEIVEERKAKIISKSCRLFENLENASSATSVAESVLDRSPTTSLIRETTIKPTSTQLISGSADCSIKIWDLKSGQCVRTLDGHSSYILSVELMPNGRTDTLVSTSADGKIKIWNVHTGECTRTFKRANLNANCLKLLDERRIISGGFDSTIKIWDIESGECLQTMYGHAQWINCLAVLSRDETKIVSASADATIKIWSLDKSRCLKTLKGHLYSVKCIALIGQSRIASGAEDERIIIWDIESCVCLRILKGHTSFVMCLETLGSNRIISGSADGIIKIWDIDSGKCVDNLQNATSDRPVYSLRVNEKTHELVSAGWDQIIRVWDLHSGKLTKMFDQHLSSVKCLTLVQLNR